MAVVVGVGAALGTVLAVVWYRRRVGVWHVRDDKPYFVAHCDCDWVGTAHDATEPHARDKAFREARGHGTEVASEVDYPLG